jgi:hypothetical protein
MDDQPSSRTLVPVPKLPAALTAEARNHIRRHCVSMVVADDDERAGMPCAGVLCVIDGTAGILTAWHVWDRLSRAQKLVLMLGPNHPYRIARSLLTAYAPDRALARELLDAAVPDIAFIPLPSEIKTAIEARHKVFYSVDRRVIDADFDLYGDAGFWVAIGTPVEMMRREAQAVGSLTYVTDVEKAIDREGWDYLYVNLNLESNVPIPSNLQGMSGGGLWRVIFSVTGEPGRFVIRDPSRDIVLQGITFLQTELAGRQLIAHGPKSIYARFLPFLQDARRGEC